VVGRFVIDCGLGTTGRRLRIEILAGFLRRTWSEKSNKELLEFCSMY
jgi:hypothetical protein